MSEQRMMLKTYYSLTKSGLVAGNLITVIAGFALASRGHVDFLLLIETCLGIFFVMASGCVFNNYIDRDIDGLMERTKNRALVTGRVSDRGVIVFATVLGILGFLTLGIFTNLLTVTIAASGFFFYVFMYSLWFKRRNAFGAVVGSISGAVPPVVGYAAASGRIDSGALVLFLIMVAWQMPHFYAIAIRRTDEYAAAKVPVLPVEHGIRATKIQMLLYILAFTIVAPLLAVFGYAGRAYFMIALILGLAWLALSVRGFWISGTIANNRWARQMFLFSLIVMVVLFVAIAIGAA